MEDTEEFKWAVKVVIRRQLRLLIDQLQDSGDEVAVLVANVDDNSYSHFGSHKGEWFISEQKNLTSNFLNFCISKDKKGSKSQLESSTLSQTESKHALPPMPNLYQYPAMENSKGQVQPDNTVINVTVSSSLCTDVSEREVACIVNRIVASLMTTNKRDGSDGGTLFQSLVQLVNDPSKSKLKLTSPGGGDGEDTASSHDRKSTRSGRIVKPKCLDGMSMGKKESKKLSDEHNIINMLMEIQTDVLKKVRVKMADSKSVDVYKTVLIGVDYLESLAVLLVKSMGSLTDIVHNKGLVQVNLDIKDTTDDKVLVEIDNASHDSAGHKNETIDDSDMEYMDYDGEGDETYDNNYHENVKSDPDYVPPIVTTVVTPRMALGLSDKPHLPPRPLGLKRRKRRKDTRETTLITCQQCGTTVTSKNYQSHIKRVHLKIRNYVCDICKKGFWSNETRQSHMLSVHTRRCDECHEYVVESVPWADGICMKTKRDVLCACGGIVSIFSSFGRRREYLRDDEPDEEGNVRTPRAKNEPGTNFACGVCGKLFNKKSYCERHARSHTKEKAIVCDHCDTAFTFKSSLMKHLKNVHGVVKFMCDVCGNSYSNKMALKVHKSKCHPMPRLGDLDSDGISEGGNQQNLNTVGADQVDDENRTTNSVTTEQLQQLLQEVHALKQDGNVSVLVKELPSFIDSQQ